MVRNRIEQVAIAAIMHEEQSLAEAPQWRRAELLWTGAALSDSIGQRRIHFVQGEVGKWMEAGVIQRTGQRGGGCQEVGMA